MAEENFKEMELWEHLAELRTRIVRSLIYIVVGAIVVWIFRDRVWAFLWAPLQPVLKRYGEGNGEILITMITEMFTVQMQIALIGGLIGAVPFITYELWGFIAPGLTRSERKGFYFVGPLAIFFFLCGLATAYLVLPAAFAWFAQFLIPTAGPKAKFIPVVTPYVLFLVKMCLAFGLVFELPVVLMFFAWIGLVNSKLLISGWRHAIVGCAAVAAVATPSNDAPTMLMMAVPLIVLYFFSIVLVKFVERVRGTRAASHWLANSDSGSSNVLPDAR
jgi:sec-independent protein translocase protein TatC